MRWLLRAKALKANHKNLKTGKKTGFLKILGVFDS